MPDPTSPSQIWVYEKGTDRVFKTTIKSVANENHRWPDEIENYLANKIENPANPILDKIRSYKQITPEDKDILSAYMVVIWQRVDKGLLRREKLAPKVIKDTFDLLNNEILKLIEKYPLKAADLLKSRNTLQGLRQKYEKEFPKELWYYGITPDTPLQVRFIMRDMTWVFLTTNRSPSFLTNDNPLFLRAWVLENRSQK